MAFRNLRRKKNNRSARADIHAIEFLRKVDRRGSRKVLRINFVLNNIESQELSLPSYEYEFDLWPRLGE